MVRSIDDIADIYGRGKQVRDEMQRAALNTLPIAKAPAEGAGDGKIPDVKGAPTGILGIKAPTSVRQTSDIQDRLMAAGVKMPELGPKR